MNILSQFQKVNSADRVLNTVQDNIAKVTNPIASNALVNGYVLHQVVLVTGSNSIEHKLGRNLQGWFITRLRGAASIYDAQDANPLPASFLLLQSSADVTVDIYVF